MRIADKILKNASHNGSAIIVHSGDQELSWDSLIEEALSFAKQINIEFEANSNVPILIDRSCNSVVAILGVILSGRSVSPIAADQPFARTRECLRILTAGKYIKASTLQICPVPIEDTSKQFLNVPPELFYVLFTSGSTGNPKGVMVSEKNLENTLMWAEEQELIRGDAHLGIAGQFSFDIALFDLFVGLYFNRPITILREPRNPALVLEEICSTGINSIFATPMFFSQFVKYDLLHRKELVNLKRIISGGDFFPPSHIAEFHKNLPLLEILNVWGPTETSVVNTAYKLTPRDFHLAANGGTPSIGRTTRRMTVEVWDENDQVCGVGEVGELIITGQAVSLGYLGTKDAVTESAFFREKGESGFRTGDYGFADENGLLYLIGRNSNFYKVQGYRVDPHEIENLVETSPYVYKSCVVSKLQDDAHCLVLLVEIKNHTIDTQRMRFELRQLLQEKLPRYMIPRDIHVVDSIPLNVNGKVDRRKVGEYVLELINTEG